ncbi:hypothetical protein D3C84_366510 [compost metagenome]
MSDVEALAAWVLLRDVAHDQRSLVVQRECIDSVISVREVHHQNTNTFHQTGHIGDWAYTNRLLASKSLSGDVHRIEVHERLIKGGELHCRKVDFLFQPVEEQLKQLNLRGDALLHGLRR